MGVASRGEARPAAGNFSSAARAVPIRGLSYKLQIQVLFALLCRRRAMPQPLSFAPLGIDWQSAGSIPLNTGSSHDHTHSDTSRIAGAYIAPCAARRVSCRAERAGLLA